ncbi:hypothetical protein Nepgr_027689 [Nepenthes gracilis]|uniref:UBA domain-containing protein n=1 Tax=Nepenthes gracilis TaxID=150966 RepID=A0AAD3Y3T3_NEPGR|nr:hypothetical protein Nepgr_027689 [Nepenthes gracilis]
MAVTEVDSKLLAELEAMGFTLARAVRALYYSGNSSVVDALNWIFENQNDPDIDQMPLVPVDINLESPKPFDITEEVKKKAEELRRNGAPKATEEKKMELEREREKKRITVGKELLEAKRIAEENERKRVMTLRKAEKDEEKRAREIIRRKLEADKAERRSWLGQPPGVLASIQPIPASHMEPGKLTSAPIKSTKDSELLTNCLRSLRRNCKDDDAKVQRAFRTLHIYVRNAMKNPGEEKFRKIRLTNPVFQERVGKMKGGVRFLELCGFERANGGQFLYLPRNKVDMAVLDSAMAALQTAMTNPFFGLLSVDLSDE